MLNDAEDILALSACDSGSSQQSFFAHKLHAKQYMARFYKNHPSFKLRKHIEILKAVVTI